ncbi:CaiB/BaiF CoA-transferase family protein [Limibacillus sp. MBR-115]|jgi:crotonobetainyl-CoA:carnitine CoA-transferase CaiB-like acyl-CoA transferase|uniref:CaiB/BaiF CoA transferase family protein n=1 Tax=Limibacillus sp. MBR-115 TaxID=3156465 RepID=UPI003393CD0C
MPGPLSGILVVALEQAVAAPYCSCKLAEAGARVIKVERPEGDFARGYDHAVMGESTYFVWLNRGKESIALNVKDDADRALLERIVSKADVFLQNLGPGAAERLGFGAEDLTARYPNLITCSISGYGEEGPYAAMRAYDLLVQAESGLASVTGRPEGPGRVGVSVVDVGTGMYAYQAILEALIERGRTGRGKAISLSLFAAMADWMTVPFLQCRYGGKAPERVGLAHPSIAPYGAFASQEGKWIVISIQNEREWMRLCEQVLQRPDLLKDPAYAGNAQRVANRSALDALIAEHFACHGLEELAAALEAAQVAFGRVSEVPDLLRHPALREVKVETPGGSAAMPAPPASFDGRLRQPGPVPALDEQGEALRREFSL